MKEMGNKYQIAFFVILAVFIFYCIIVVIDASKIPSYKWTDSYLLYLIPLPVLLGMAIFAALKAWSGNQRMKRFFIFAAVMVAIIAISCIFLWEWDGLLYIIWLALAAVGIYVYYLKRKLDGRL